VTPTRRRSNGRPQAVPTPLGREREEARVTAGGTILVAEDNSLLRELISAIVEACGYEVVAAASGCEAVQAAARCTGRLSLLITDVEMPGMSGPELARRLQAGMGSLKVLLLSGHDREEVLADLGGLRLVFVRKPFTARVLAQTVREMLA
jgi:two-component system cell cycle sensor histidine kinase/response regulator CckA